MTSADTHSSRERAVEVGLALFALSQLGLGAAMALAPGTFFEEVAPFGVRNVHYIGDLATFYLAFGVGGAVAVRRRAWRVPVLAVIAVQYAFHVVNHVIDIGETDPGYLGPANAASLALTLALVLWLLAASRSSSEGTGS